MSHYAGWTEDRINAAKRRFIDGESAAEIANALGGGLTRNAVIGKAHRMGWISSHRQQATSAGRHRTTSVAARPNPPRPGPQNRPGVVFGAVSVDSQEEAERRRRFQQAENAERLAAMSEPANDVSLPLMDRGRFQCSWPVGEAARPADQLCCGMPVPDGANQSVATYCPAHARKAVSRTLIGGKPDAKVYERSLRRFA